MSKLLIHSGGNGTKGVAPGSNVISVHTQWDFGSELCPLKKWGVWNDGYFNLLKGYCSSGLKAGRKVEVVLSSTAVLRRPLLEDHCFYHTNGGPITAIGKNSGVPEFFQNPDIMLCLLAEIHRCLPEKEYPNLIIFLCWEHYCGWVQGGLEWGIKMCDKWQVELKDNRPIGTGTPYIRHIRQLNKNREIPAIQFIEAWNFNKFRAANWIYIKWANRKTIIAYNGFWPDKRLYWEQRNDKLKQAYFTPGREYKNAAKTIKQMAKMLDYYINPSYPFEQLMKDTYGNKKWWNDRFKVDTSGYDTTEYVKIVKEYVMSIPVQEYLEDQTKEARKNLKLYTRKIVDGLKAA